jgi:hypothetical protein
MVVSTNPEGSFFPGIINLAITPAKKPITMVQIIPMGCTPQMVCHT